MVPKVVGSNPIFHPNNEARRCLKTSFCFLYLASNLFVGIGIENKSGLRSSFLRSSLEVPPRRAEGKGVKRHLCRSQSHLPPKQRSKKMSQDIFLFLCHATNLGLLGLLVKIGMKKNEANKSCWPRLLYV